MIRLITISLLTLIASCDSSYKKNKQDESGKESNQINNKEDSNILIPNPKYKITLFQANYVLFNIGNDSLKSFESVNGKYAGSKPWTPSVAQILQLETNMFNLIKNYKAHSDTINLEYSPDFRNELSEGLNFILANLDSYNRQYTSCLTRNNTKIISIEFYHKNSAPVEHLPPANLPDEGILTVMGGGAQYFHLTYNFDLSKVTSIVINSSM